jgi:hypothetical protein
VIEHRGESLQFLRQRGFNAVKLAGPPTAEMLDEARRLGIWLVCPPPQAANFGDGANNAAAMPELGPAFAPVLAWDLGTGLTARELDATQRRSEELHRLDSQASRPTLCQPESDLLGYSRRVDLVLMRHDVLATSFEQDDYAIWLRQRIRLVRPGTPVWTTVETEPSPELVDEIALLSGNRAPAPVFYHDQVRAIAYQALAAGVRGLVFRSVTRLDSNDPTTRLRVAHLELLNLELELLEPWTSAGGQATSVQGSIYTPPAMATMASSKMTTAGDLQSMVNPQAKASPNVRGFLLHTERAQLLLPLWAGRGGQIVPGQWSGNNLFYTLPGVPESTDVYEITTGGLRPPMRRQRVTGGVRVTLDELGMASMIVLTQDPLVIGTVTRRLQETGRRAAELQRELATEQFQRVTEVDAQLSAMGERLPKAAEWFQQSRQAMTRSEQRFNENDMTGAFAEARRAIRPLQVLARTHWEKNVRVLTSPLVSPLALSFESLPEHQTLMARLSANRWAPNQLPEGNFDNLDRMLQSGWQNFQHALPNVRSVADLSPISPSRRGYSLHLGAESSDENAAMTLVETAPVWLTSPGIPVQRGQWLRIRGSVYMPEPINGSLDGLMIFDNHSGPALAERIGQTTHWQEFVLLRAARSEQPFSLTFALTGLGDVFIDDVAIEPWVEMAPAGAAAPGSNLPASAFPPASTLPPRGAPGELPPPPAALPIDPSAVRQYTPRR